MTISAGGCSKTVTIVVKKYVNPQTTYSHTPSYNSYSSGNSYSGGSSESSSGYSSGSSSGSSDNNTSGSIEIDIDAEMVDEEDW